MEQIEEPVGDLLRGKTEPIPQLFVENRRQQVKIISGAMAGSGAFNPTSNQYVYDLGEEGMYLTGATLIGFFRTPINLPSGAVLTKLSFATVDNSTTPYSLASIKRTSNANPSDSQFLTYVNTQGLPNNPGWQQLAASNITNPVIDNATFSYYAEIRLNGRLEDSIMAGPVVIEYTYATPGG